MGSQVLEKLVLDTKSVSLNNFAGTHFGGIARMYTGVMSPGPGPSVGSVGPSLNVNPLSPQYIPPSYGIEIANNHNYLDVNRNINATTINPTPSIPKIEPLYQPNLIGTHSDFNAGSKNNLRRDLGFGLQERFDFSGHGGSEPHVNYDIISNNYLNTEKTFKPLSKNPLGDSHYKNLF